MVVVTRFTASARRGRVQDDEIHLERDEFGRELGKPLGPPVRIAPLHGEVLSLDVAKVP